MNEDLLVDNINDPELNGKYMGQISSDFVKVADQLKEASYQIRARKLSLHPIFTTSREPIAIGSSLFAANDMGNSWYYGVSSVEEFLQRGLITEDNIEHFEKSYRDPDEFCCLFVVDKEFINFVYIPFPEE